MDSPRRLDPRSPLVLDTHELGRRPGSMRRVQVTVAAPEHLGTEVIGIPAGSDLSLDLRLEAVMEGVLVSGSIRGRAVGECVRCLEEVVEDIDVPIQELYAYPERVRAATEPATTTRTRSASWTATSSTSSPRSATPSCLRYRSSRWTTPTARGCAPSAGLAWRTIPTTRMRSLTRAGPS